MTTPKRPPRTPRSGDAVGELAELTTIADGIARELRRFVHCGHRCTCIGRTVLRRYDRHRARVERVS